MGSGAFLREQVLVTGGSGFLGSALVRALLAGGARVRCVQRRSVPQLAALGAQPITADLRDGAVLTAAARGCRAVFHTAALPGIWGSYQTYWDANVLGTRKVLTACADAGVPLLIHTSSPSVVFAGHDETGIDESAPIPTQHLCHYSATKAIAEHEVLVAHGPRVRTVALRPHLIWGPGDAHLLPRLAIRARAGRLRLIGTGRNRIDSTCIGNAVAAHLAAAAELAGQGRCGGKAYFVSNGDPLPIAELIARLLATQGISWTPRCIGAGTGYAIGSACEALWSLLALPGEPPVTRFVARQLATEHFFDLAAIARDCGWRPAITTAQGLAELAAARSTAAHA